MCCRSRHMRIWARVDQKLSAVYVGESYHRDLITFKRARQKDSLDSALIQNRKFLFRRRDFSPGCVFCTRVMVVLVSIYASYTSFITTKNMKFISSVEDWYTTSHFLHYDLLKHSVLVLRVAHNSHNGECQQSPSSSSNATTATWTTLLWTLWSPSCNKHTPCIRLEVQMCVTLNHVYVYLPHLSNFSHGTHWSVARAKKQQRCYIITDSLLADVCVVQSNERNVNAKLRLFSSRRLFDIY